MENIYGDGFRFVEASQLWPWQDNATWYFCSSHADASMLEPLSHMPIMASGSN